MAVHGVDVGNHVCCIKSSAISIHQSDGCTRISRNTTSLVIVNVREFIADHFVARTCVHLDCDLVGHGPRWTKQGRFLPRQFSAPVLQSLNAFILSENVVSNWCVVHDLTHSFGGLSHSVTSEIYKQIWREWLELIVLS